MEHISGLSFGHRGTTLAFVCAATIAAPCPGAAQTSPVAIHATASAIRLPVQFGELPSVRGLSGGRVLIKDQGGARLLLVDSTCTVVTVTAGSGSSWGTPFPETLRMHRLIPYRGDSTLLGDQSAQGFLVIDDTGRIVRVFAHVRPQDLLNAGLAFQGVPGIDTAGRLIYRGRSIKTAASGSTVGAPDARDTIRIVRADFATRAVDTIGAFTVPRSEPAQFGHDANGKVTATLVMKPIRPAPDDWVVLSDGTVAIVRAQDYHIDWIYPDGRAASTARMPFAWRRLTDADKQGQIDSAKAIVDSVLASGKPYVTYYRPRPGPTPGSTTGLDTIIPKLAWAPPADLPDYIPPIRSGSVLPDADGNLWILPTTSSEAHGGLLYDVVNRRGEVFERVQLPPACVIAGFGPGGFLFLGHHGDAGWTIERTRVLQSASR